VETAKDAAIVTGGGRGIGRAIASALGAAGFSVAVLARSEEQLAETEAKLVEKGVSALALAVDVRDAAAVGEAARRAEEALGPVSVLVNNAGAGRALGPLWSVDAEEWWDDVEISLRGAFNACRAVLPSMLTRRRGRIINIASYVAIRPSPYQTGYAAGKAALVNLTESLAASLADQGIQAFAFSPGYVETEMTRHIRESEAGRRWLPEVGTGPVLDAEDGARFVAALALGRGDILSGRFLHALDDLNEAVRRAAEVESLDLYAPRLRRLDTS
jgi:NAD(P)-dependent dehydrogenase (short-subunit alcohol dehydrogenase family)